MARIRSVKPELCTSERMAGVSAVAERTFVRLWTHCDDEGRCKDHPKLLKASLFPLHDDVTAEDIDGHLWELVDKGCIVRYEVDGDHYLSVPSWHDHQKPQKRQVSKLPAPDQGELRRSGTTTRPLREGYGPVVEGRVEVEVEVVGGVAVPSDISPQPPVVEPAPLTDVEIDQQTNKAVGLLAKTRAVDGFDPPALAASIGKNLPAHERAELRDMIAAGTSAQDAAATLADFGHGISMAGTAHDPEAVAAADRRARNLEADTAARLAAMAAPLERRPLAEIRSITGRNAS